MIDNVDNDNTEQCTFPVEHDQLFQPLTGAPQSGPNACGWLPTGATQRTSAV